MKPQFSKQRLAVFFSAWLILALAFPSAACRHEYSASNRDLYAFTL